MAWRWSRVSFRNHCINAYELAERKWKETAEKDAEDFRREAVKRFKGMFKTPVTSSSPINRRTAEITIDDVTVIAQRPGAFIEFYTLRECSECRDRFVPQNANNCVSLSDIGRDLSTPTVCDNCLKTMHQHETKVTEETITEKLREIFEIVQH